MPAENTRTCPICATAIPASFPEGFCPKCLLASATPPAAVEAAAEADKTIVVPAPTPSQIARPGGVPSVEALRRMFPDLEILDVLGAGGMGAVYKARQPRLNRLVALKIMVAAPGHEADFALRFEREAQVLARLSHPHIVILYDFGELGPERTGADPLYYFLMEYVDGTDLGQLIKSKELKSAQSLLIVPQICEALQYAHDQGITHRDIKPANILIDKRGTVKIADFGLAKMITGTEEALMTGLTQTGTAMGTPHYMAPEQWEHPELVDHRADIYALGVVFYEMLTGERPAGVFEPPSKKSSPPVDKKLDGVVMRAMDKNPARRYQQAGQIGDDVTRISGANKSKPAPRDTPDTQRSPLKPILVLGAAAVLATGGWWVWQSSEAGPPAATTPPLAAQTAVAPRTSKALAAFPAGQWTRVLSTQAEVDALVGLKGKVTVKPDGWLDFSGPEVAPGVGLMDFSAANAGVRVKGRIADREPLPVVVMLTLRHTTSPPPRTEGYRLHITGGETANPIISLAHYDNSTRKTTHFKTMLRPGKLNAGEEFSLELYTIGSRLFGRFNGEPLLQAEDQRLTRGALTLQTGHLLRDIEVINLDGLSEAEALKVAGLDSAVPTIVPVPTKKVLGGPSALPSLIGRLRGSGFHLDGKPLDLKRAEGITDFVQVILTDRGWVGLRANGEQVSPDDVWSSKNQARLLPGPSNTFAIIDREGRLKIGRMNNGGVSVIPEDVQRIGVVDACWEDGQAIALLKDGSVRVWGEHYTSDYEGPKWPAPPAEALRDVRKIALMRNRAATLRSDGKWFVWGGQEGNSGPFDLEPFQKWGEIADIATAKDAFRVLTRSGQVYNLGGSRPLASGLVAEGIEAISDQMLLPKGSPVWTWNSSKSRASAQAEVDALLQQIGNRPRGGFDLRVVGEHDSSNVAAVWIEPVETGGAAAAPATVPSKPGRLEGTGTMATGRTLELVKFDAYEDFMDVAGGADLILALRANGETVSSDGQADFQGIRRIARSFQGYHCFIDMAGSLRFHPSREMTLPSSLKGRVVVDAACGSHHGVALLEGGQAMVFGKRYEEAMDDMSKRDGTGTPRWPQPEAAALQKVKGVAVTYTHAATLHEDGTVSVWGWEGPVKWQPEAKMKPVRQISSHHDSLHLLDEAGQVWSFPMPRSAHPEQPVGVNGTVKPLDTAAVRLRDHLWLGEDGAWHGVAADRPVQELLERTELQPETTFALLSSTANAIPFSYVLWIEPVSSASPIRQ